VPREVVNVVSPSAATAGSLAVVQVDPRHVGAGRRPEIVGEEVAADGLGGVLRHRKGRVVGGPGRVVEDRDRDGGGDGVAVRVARRDGDAGDGHGAVRDDVIQVPRSVAVTVTEPVAPAAIAAAGAARDHDDVPPLDRARAARVGHPRPGDLDAAEPRHLDRRQSAPKAVATMSSDPARKITDPDAASFGEPGFVPGAAASRGPPRRP
jgi:hypothetical protein